MKLLNVAVYCIDVFI